MSGEIFQFSFNGAGFLSIVQERGMLAQVNKGKKLQRFIPTMEYSPPGQSLLYVREFGEGLQCALKFWLDSKSTLETIEIWREPPYMQIPYGDAASFDIERLKFENPDPRIVSIAYESSMTEGNFCYRFNGSGDVLPLIEVSTSTGFDAFNEQSNKVVKINPNFSLDPGAVRSICFRANAMLLTPKIYSNPQAEDFCQSLQTIFSPFFPAPKQ